MPELPEVETIRQQLAVKIVGKKIKGKEIIGLRRRGKILIIDFNNGSSLVFHLKMTGQLIFNGEPSRHTRKVFIFDDNSKLIFNDLRKFGWYKTVKQTKKIEERFGPESLDVSLSDFQKILKKRPNSKIKNLLMDQKFIAGIGNIYSDEILFASKIYPLREIKSLTLQEIRQIHKNIKMILKAAIKAHGSSSQHYLDAFGKKGDYLKYHQVYRRQEKACFVCRTKIKRLKTGGRSAHYCPKCQK